MKKPTRNEAMIAVRIDADVKERADLILMKLGVSTKTLIDALYKQVVYTNSVPFSLALPEEPAATELLNKWDLDAMLERSYEQASQGEGKRLADVAANSEYEVFLTTDATQSLDDAWNYFAIDLRSPEVADRYVSRLADDTAALGENPYKHELVRDEPWRSRTVGRCLSQAFWIYYYVDADNKAVWVLDYVLARRDHLRTEARSRIG